MKPFRSLAVIGLAFFFLFSLPVHADVNLTYSKNLDDTQAIQGDPAVNYGTGVVMWVQTISPSNAGRVYIKFDVSSIPNVTINSATLWLYAPTVYNRGINYLLAYNTSLNWTEHNLTWNAQPTIGTLQQNLSVDTTLGGNRWINWSVTNAMKNAIMKGESLSIMIKDDNETANPAHMIQFDTKEFAGTTYRPFMTINYSVSNCVVDCGACGCLGNTSECYVPPIIGSYCDNEDGAPNTIKTVYNTSCVGTSYYACPVGTGCSQVTPVFNFSSSQGPTGENQLWTPANLDTWCSGCYFINFVNVFTGLTTGIINTNCYERDANFVITRIKTECDCNGVSCSWAKYTVNNTSSNFIEQWSAGCFNPSTGMYNNIINATGINTTLDNLITSGCSDCIVSNNTPSTGCPLNTTTTCYDANCATVTCPGSPGASSDSAAGGLAGLFGTLFGISDVSVSLAVFSLFISIAVGFVLMYYTRNSAQGGNTFIFGTLAPLIMFAIMGWFPGWILILLLVAGAFLVAKSMGFGGG